MLFTAKFDRFKGHLEGNYWQYHQGQHILQSVLVWALYGFLEYEKNKTFDPPSSAGVSHWTTEGIQLTKRVFEVSALAKCMYESLYYKVRWSVAQRCWSWTVTWRWTATWWCPMMRTCWGRPATTSASPRSGYRWGVGSGVGSSKPFVIYTSFIQLCKRAAFKVNIYFPPRCLKPQLLQACHSLIWLINVLWKIDFYNVIFFHCSLLTRFIRALSILSTQISLNS